MPRITIIISDKPPQPYRLPLDADAITIGRGGENDIHIASESVSVHHAKMHRIPGGFELRDLGSTNGLKYEGEKKIFVRLRSGMTVRIGEADFYFELSSAEQVELREEAPADERDLELVETKPAKPSKKKKKKEPEEETSAHPSDSEFDSDDQPSSSAFSGRAILAFLILVVIAFLVGMAVRHQKDTGSSLIHSVLSRSQPSKTPASEPKSAESAEAAPESEEAAEPAAEPSAEPEEEAKEEADDGFGFAE